MPPNKQGLASLQVYVTENVNKTVHASIPVHSQRSRLLESEQVQIISSVDFGRSDRASALGLAYATGSRGTALMQLQKCAKVLFSIHRFSGV